MVDSKSLFLEHQQFGHLQGHINFCDLKLSNILSSQFWQSIRALKKLKTLKLILTSTDVNFQENAILNKLW